MRRPTVAGNWKMHGSRTENARLIEELLAHCPAQPAAACVVCPPFVYLQEVGRLLRDSVFSLGAQDVCADAQGAFTGEVYYPMRQFRDDATLNLVVRTDLSSSQLAASVRARRSPITTKPSAWGRRCATSCKRPGCTGRPIGATIS